MKRRSIALALVIVPIIAAAVTWEVASPWWTLKGMRDAARAGDSGRLVGYVDFPRVRADLREQLTREVADRLPPHYFSALVVKQGARLIADPLVDAIVSPKSLKIALDVVPKSKDSRRTAGPSCGINRVDLDHFRVRCAQFPGGPAELVFERQGLSWKMIGINLSDDYLAKAV